MKNFRINKVWLLSLAAFVAGVALLIGCTGHRSSLPNPAQLSKPDMLSKDADIASMERGRTLFVTECATCHRTYWPRQYPPTAWRGIARDMGRRSSLSSDQIKDLEAYLVESSRFTRKAEE